MNYNNSFVKKSLRKTTNEIRSNKREFVLNKRFLLEISFNNKMARYDSYLKFNSS